MASYSLGWVYCEQLLEFHATVCLCDVWQHLSITKDLQGTWSRTGRRNKFRGSQVQAQLSDRTQVLTEANFRLHHPRSLCAFHATIIACILCWVGFQFNLPRILSHVWHAGLPSQIVKPLGELSSSSLFKSSLDLVVHCNTNNGQ
jgi:hypothetical protein